MKNKRLCGAVLLCSVMASPAVLAAGQLTIEKAWIRTSPPGAMMLAGYAIVHNSGDMPVVISGADSSDFGDVSLHESRNENGVERMRPLGDVAIAAGATVAFAPAGKHFMLMQPKRDLKAGDRIKIHLDTSSGTGADADFIVRDDAP